VMVRRRRSRTSAADAASMRHRRLRAARAGAHHHDPRAARTGGANPRRRLGPCFDHRREAQQPMARRCPRAEAARRPLYEVRDLGTPTGTVRQSVGRRCERAHIRAVRCDRQRFTRSRMRYASRRATRPDSCPRVAASASSPSSTTIAVVPSARRRVGELRPVGRPGEVVPDVNGIAGGVSKAVAPTPFDCAT